MPDFYLTCGGIAHLGGLPLFLGWVWGPDGNFLDSWTFLDFSSAAIPN
jgi:hypothetical protein